MKAKERIINAYHISKNIIDNFKKNGDIDQVGYDLSVLSIINGLKPIQALTIFAFMKGFEYIHIDQSELLGLLSVGIYALSKFEIYRMNKKMLESENGWSSDIYANAYSYAGLCPKKAAEFGAITEFMFGTVLNPLDLTAGTLIFTPLSNVSTSFFLSKSLLVPLCFGTANLLISSGYVGPVLNKVKKMRNSLAKKLKIS